MKRSTSIKLLIFAGCLLILFGSGTDNRAQAQTLDGVVSWEKEKIFLDGLVRCLRDDKEKIGLVSYTFDISIPRRTAKAHVKSVNNYLMKTKKISYNQLRVVFTAYGRQRIEFNCIDINNLTL